MPLWPLPIWASALLDAAVAVWVLTRVGPYGIRAVVALASGACLWLVKLAFLVALGLTVPFGVLHVLYLDVVVALPLVALALARQAWRAGPVARTAVAAGLLLAPLGAYASFVEPSRLEVETATVAVPGERAGGDPIRIAVLADLQTTRVGRHETEAVERLLALSPDLILVPGDIHQGSAAVRRQELPALRKLLGRLRAPGGTFFVPGDTEGAGEAEEVLAGTGVTILDNDIRRVRLRDRRLTIAGVELDYQTRAARATIERLQHSPGARDIRILLAHRPDPVLELEPRTRIDLVVAGHTHGGQVQLPLIGPPVIFSAVPRSVGAGGLHDIGAGRRIYVSRGVGLERNQAPRLRLGAPPEISLLTLQDP